MDKENKRLIAKNKKIFVIIMEKVLWILSLVWIYTPVIAGILIAMAWYLPFAFASWWIFSFFGTNWMLMLIQIRSEIALIILIVIESILFIIGLTLFIWGLIYLAKVKREKQGLATGGPYKFTRHPQHLGLILMTLANSLYLPWAIHPYIRIGSILSWSLIALFLIVISELEEKKLLKEYGNTYLDYLINTGMFLPRIFTKYKKKKEITEIKHWKRFLLIAVIYAVFIGHIRLLVEIAPYTDIIPIGMWYDYLPKSFRYVNLIVLGLILLYFGIKLIIRRIYSTDVKPIEEKPA